VEEEIVSNPGFQLDSPLFLPLRLEVEHDILRGIGISFMISFSTDSIPEYFSFPLVPTP
jgi:hypothetical protein